MTTVQTPISVKELKAADVDVASLRRQMRPDDAVYDINDVAMIVRENWEHMSKNQIEACRLRVDIARLRLSKFIPDLKAVDHTVGGDTSKVQFVINLTDETAKII